MVNQDVFNQPVKNLNVLTCYLHVTTAPVTNPTARNSTALHFTLRVAIKNSKQK